MSKFWPSGISLSDTKSPEQILQAAKEEWETTSKGLLTLELQPAESQSGNAMMIVHAKDIPGNRTTTLFSVVHRKEEVYPVAIQPEKDDLPNFLKKTYYKPGIRDISVAGMGGYEVQNKWVADTPAEFRTKLEEIFNDTNVKQAVFSLLAHTPSVQEEDIRGSKGEVKAEG